MESKRTVFLILVDTEIPEPTIEGENLDGLFQYALRALTEADIPVWKIDLALLEDNSDPTRLGENIAMDIFYFFCSPFSILYDEPEDDDDEEGESSFVEDLIQESALINGIDESDLSDDDTFPEGRYAYVRIFSDEKTYHATLKALREYELDGNNIEVISFPSSLSCFVRHFMTHLISGNLPESKKRPAVKIKPGFRELLEKELGKRKKKN